MIGDAGRASGDLDDWIWPPRSDDHLLGLAAQWERSGNEVMASWARQQWVRDECWTLSETTNGKGGFLL